MNTFLYFTLFIETSFFFKKQPKNSCFDDKKYRQKSETENETVNWFHETGNSFTFVKKKKYIFFLENF